MAHDNISAWLASIELDLKLYLQARFQAKQPALAAGFRTLLFSPDSTTAEIVSKQKEIGILLNNSPNSTAALYKTTLVLEQLKNYHAMGMVDKLTDLGQDRFSENNPVWDLMSIANDLYYQNSRSTLLTILQKNIFDLANDAKVGVILETAFKNYSGGTHPDGNVTIYDQVREKYYNDQAARVKLLSNNQAPHQDFAAWQTETTNNLRLYLQWKYLQKTEAFSLSNLFAPAQFHEEFINTLFAQGELDTLMRMEKNFKLLLGNSKNSRQAFQEALDSVKKEDPADTLSAFKIIADKLKKHGNSSGLQPVLNHAVNKLEMLLQPNSLVTAPEETTIKSMQNRVDQYLQAHPTITPTPGSTTPRQQKMK